MLPLSLPALGRPVPQALFVSLLLFLPLLAAPSAAAANDSEADATDWPQWRGPARTGVSTEASWSPVGAPEPLWRKSLGVGHSSFAVVGDRVYTMGYDDETGLDVVFCLDADTGAEHWTYRYAAEKWDIAHDGGTQTTPTAVGDDLITSNREGRVFCFDAETGAVKWWRNLREEKQVEPPKWGFSASPLVVGDLVIMNVDTVVALDRHTGADVWQTEKGYGICYSTPAAFEGDGKALLANLSGDGLAVLDRADGTEVAFYDWVKRPQIYPMTPVVIGDRVFISAGYDRGCEMLRLEGGELTSLWGSRVMRNKMSGCVLYDDHLFGFDESILKCIDLDGKMKWRVRGLGTGSMTIAGGRLVILDGKGQVIVAEANPEEYVELSKQKVFDDGTSWSTPVLSHGRIFCRSSKGEMACLDHRGGGAAAIAAAAAREVDVPSAESIVARHRAAVGAAAAAADVTALRMTGTGESLRNTVHVGEVQLDWEAGKGFSWQDDTGFQLAHDAELGWITGVRSGPAVLEGEALHALREAGDLRRVLDPASAYAQLESREATVFDNRPCYAVAATTPQGYARTLYFEIDTGLFAGHEGEGILMWTLGGYREFDGVTLPTRWAFYEPEKGEMSSAEFDSVELSAATTEDRFAIPPLVRLFLRTPEEIAAANERLLRVHAGVVGTWRGEDWPEDDPDNRFEVSEGFLQLTSGDRPARKLTEPDEDGVVRMIGAEYVSFTPVKDAAGEVSKVEVRVGRDLEEVLLPTQR